MSFEIFRNQTNFVQQEGMELEAPVSSEHRVLEETIELNPVSPLQQFGVPEVARLGLNLIRSQTYIAQEKDAPFAELHLQNLIANQKVNRYYKENLASVQQFREEMLTLVWTDCRDLKCSLNTYYLAVSYLDVVFAHYSLNRSQSRVCAYSAVILAAKLEEKVDKIPQISDSIEYLNNNFDEKMLMHYEEVIFRCLSFQLNVKTPFTLMNAYLTLGVVTEEEYLQAYPGEQAEQVVSYLERVTGHFLEIATQNYDFNQFSSQVVAAASIACAKRCLGLDAFGPQSLRILRLEWSDLEACVKKLLQSARETNSDCYRKYSREIQFIEDEISQTSKQLDGQFDELAMSVNSEEQERKRIPFSRENTASTLKNGRKPKTPENGRSSAKKEKMRPTSRRGGSFQENEFQPVTPAKDESTIVDRSKDAFSMRRATRNMNTNRSQ